MLDASKLVQQVEVMALHYAIQAALAGEIPWTGELAQEYNKRWLARSAPAIYKVIPNADEEAICADEQCGGFCVLVGIDLKDSHYCFIHECQTCSRRYQVQDRVYLWCRNRHMWSLSQKPAHFLQQLPRGPNGGSTVNG